MTTSAPNAPQDETRSKPELNQPASWFDLITIDVADPIAEASFWVALLDLSIQENEDDGRWIVLADAGGRRILGFQRCDPREVASRQPGHGLVELDAALESDAKRLGARRGDRRRQLVSAGGLTMQFLDDASTHSGGVRGVVDVVDPVAAAGFWADVTGLHLTASNPVRVDLGREPEGFIAFRKAAQPASRSLIHWDLECHATHFDDEVDRLLTLGATRVGVGRTEHFGQSQIMADKHGLIFCLNAYTPALADGVVSAAVARGRPTSPSVDTPVNVVKRQR